LIGACLGLNACWTRGFNQHGLAVIDQLGDRFPDVGKGAMAARFFRQLEINLWVPPADKFLDL
jgi:hypothetical protein